MVIGLGWLRLLQTLIIENIWELCAHFLSVKVWANGQYIRKLARIILFYFASLFLFLQKTNNHLVVINYWEVIVSDICHSLTDRQDMMSKTEAGKISISQAQSCCWVLAVTTPTPWTSSLCFSFWFLCSYWWTVFPEDIAECVLRLWFLFWLLMK